MADGSRSFSFLSASDRQLLTERLTTRDPEADTSRIRLAKQNPGPPIVLQYDIAPGPSEDPRREYVWCGHCGKPTHWRGYVVETTDGTLVNLGGMCGVKHFGFAFGAVENAFDDRVERQAILPRLVMLREALPEVTVAVRRLISRQPTYDVDDLRHSFQERWPALWRALQTFVSAGHFELSVTLRVPDPEGAILSKDNIRRHYQRVIDDAPTKTARVKARREMHAALGGVGERLRDETRRHGYLRGRAFVEASEDMVDAFVRIHGALKSLQAVLDVRDTDDLSTGTMKATLRDALRLLEEAEGIAAQYDAAQQFWAAEHLRGIAGWANDNDFGRGSRWEVLDGALAMNGYSLALPAGFSVPVEADFTAFRARMAWGRRTVT